MAMVADWVLQCNHALALVGKFHACAAKLFLCYIRTVG